MNVADPAAATPATGVELRRHGLARRVLQTAAATAIRALRGTAAMFSFAAGETAPSRTFGDSRRRHVAELDEVHFEERESTTPGTVGTAGTNYVPDIGACAPGARRDTGSP